MTRVAEVQAKDLEALIDFLVRYPGETRGHAFWEERLRHWWDENPAFTSDSPRGWAIFEEEGAHANGIVGFLGNIPGRFQMEGRPVPAFNATTWRVLPEYRNQSLALLFRQIAAGKDGVVFNTTPNAAVCKVLEAMRFRPLRALPQRQSLVPLDFSAVLRHGLDAKWTMPARLATIFNAVGNTGMRLFRSKKSGKGRVEIFQKADTCFDALWNKTSHRYANTNVRSSDFLAWHCFGRENSEKQILGCFENSRLAGYMILRMRQIAKGFRDCECMDVWTEEPSEDAIVQSLLEAAEAFARDKGCHLLTLPHFNRKLGRLFRSFALCTRRVAGQAYFFAPQCSAENMDEEKSYMVGLQGDYGL